MGWNNQGQGICYIISASQSLSFITPIVGGSRRIYRVGQCTQPFIQKVIYQCIKDGGQTVAESCAEFCLAKTRSHCHHYLISCHRTGRGAHQATWTSVCFLPLLFCGFV